MAKDQKAVRNFGRNTQELAPLFAINKRLSHTLGDFLMRSSFAVPKRGFAPTQMVALVALGKGLKTYRAITILCDQGYGEDAQILLRSLFEHALDVRYISKHPNSNEAALRWLDYDWVVKHELTKVVHTDPYFEEYRQAVKGDDQKTKEIEDEALKAQEKWHFWRKEKDGKLSRAHAHWSGMSVRDLARKVGWLSHYKTLYRLASQRVHSSVGCANDYVDLQEDHSMRLKVVPSSHLVAEVLLTAHGYIEGIADYWCISLNTPQGVCDDLQAIKHEFDKLIREWLGPGRVANSLRAGQIAEGLASSDS